MASPMNRASISPDHASAIVFFCPALTGVGVSQTGVSVPIAAAMWRSSVIVITLFP